MNRLKEMREDVGLTQTELSKKIGLTQRNYSYIETGKTMLTEDVLNSLADFYHTSIDYILYRTDKRDIYPKSIMNQKK